MRLITPEDIARYPVEDVIAELRTRNQARKLIGHPPCEYKYKNYKRKLTLCHDIPDLYPFQVELPDAPPIEEFINYGLPPEEQVFQRIKIPESFTKIDKQLKFGQITRNEALAQIEVDPELVAFVEMCWFKRLTGDFQLINGEPTHISPTYWFYLNFWHMDIGLPHFRSDKHHHCGDLELFYCWDYLVVPSPVCYGIDWFTQRRVGKTYIGGCITYEPISRSQEWHGGIQSKTDTDAEKAFTKSIVKAWRRLPCFFQPLYSNSTMPKKEGLQFTPRGKKGKNDAIEVMDEEELMSDITYGASSEMFYDGQKLHRYFSDENGKSTEIDVYERWNVVKPCLWENDGTGNRIKGKAFFSTTVEEANKKGGKYYKPLWMDGDRDPEKKEDERTINEAGETVCGLWNWFMPAYCNEVWDKYGIAIVDTPTKQQQNYLKWRGDRNYQIGGIDRVNNEIENQSDEYKKQDIIRKKPRNIREAFQSVNNQSFFKTSILNKRLNDFTFGYTKEQKEFMKFGMFDWKGVPFESEVKFVETDFRQARFYASLFPRDGMANMKIPMPGGKFKPANTALFRSGADPFKYDTGDIKSRKDMSDGAQHIYAFYDPLIDAGKERKHWLTNNLVYEYLFRPDSVDELCEDYLKACIFYGCKLYPERNNDDVIKYFKSKGFEHYIQLGIRLTTSEGGIFYKQDITGGDITNDKTIQKMFRHIQNFVNEDAAYCMFPRTLQDIKDVDRNNLNPYDLFVSLGYTLMSAYEADISNRQLEQKNYIDLEILEAIYEGDLNL